MKNIIDKKYNKSITSAILAAVLYGISAPLSKLLLIELSPTLIAALLYLGAGLGMFLINTFIGTRTEAKINGKDFPYICGMIILDIAAPVLLMLGLSYTTSANAALLNNFEIVATSLIALMIFKEAIGLRMWVSIGLITIASFVLTVSKISSFSFSVGSLFVLMACICWGFENNCTRMLSMKDPRQIVVIKGLGSGTGALFIAIAGKQLVMNIPYMLLALLLGFIAYGLSIYCYILAQRELGAARTSTFYAMAPFIGVLVSWLLLQEPLNINFIVALTIMLIGTYFAVTEKHKHLHKHEELTHEHKHSHTEGHHTHAHKDGFVGEHSHIHTHEAIFHNHKHTPDIHHTHAH